MVPRRRAAGNPVVWLELQLGEGVRAEALRTRIVFELFADVAPREAENNYAGEGGEKGADEQAAASAPRATMATGATQPPAHLRETSHPPAPSSPNQHLPRPGPPNGATSAGGRPPPPFV